MEQIVVRLMEEKDIPQLVDIEKECFSMPWSEKAFKDSYELSYTHFLVAEVGGNVAGYVGVYRVGDEADITNVAVSSIYRRKGIGKSLLRELISYSQKQNILAITLEVRDSNAGAIALYEQMGFNKVGIRKNFYEKPVEDAIIYQYIFSQK